MKKLSGATHHNEEKIGQIKSELHERYLTRCDCLFNKKATDLTMDEVLRNQGITVGDRTIKEICERSKEIELTKWDFRTQRKLYIRERKDEINI